MFSLFLLNGIQIRLKERKLKSAVHVFGNAAHKKQANFCALFWCFCTIVGSLVGGFFVKKCLLAISFTEGMADSLTCLHGFWRY